MACLSFHFAYILLWWHCTYTLQLQNIFFPSFQVLFLLFALNSFVIKIIFPRCIYSCFFKCFIYACSGKDGINKCNTHYNKKRWYMNKMSLCHQLTPQWVHPPIGLKWTSNLDLKATWQLLIPQVWTNQNLSYHFHHILDYWGYFIICGYVAINSYNPQMFKCVVCHPIVM